MSLKTFNEFITESSVKMYTASNMGNRVTITVKNDKVSMTNASGDNLSLGNVGIQVDGSRKQKTDAVQAAALKGVDQLNKVSGLKWKEINPN